MEPIPFAIVGFGFIGQRHAGIVQGHPACKLVAVCDTDSARAEHVPEGIPFYGDAAEMLAAHPEAEVVCVCTPNGLHAAHAELALEQQRHVVLEKPMGLDRSTCEAVLHKALQRNRQVFIVMQNRYSPTSIWLRDLIDRDLLGEIHLVQVNCFWNRDDRYYRPGNWKGTLALDGGPLFTQFSHFVDILYWLFGDLTDIRASFHNFNHRHNTEFEDTGQVQFRLARGGMGSLNYTTAVWDRNYESSIAIIGAKGTVKVGGQYMERLEHCHIEGYTPPVIPPANPPNDYGPYKGSAANHHYIFENVVQTLRGDSSVTTNALEGLKVVEIIGRIYAQRELRG